MTTTTIAFDRLVDALRDAGKNVTVTSDKATAQCPAHDDNRASLSLGPRRDGKGVVAHCHAGCQILDIIAALGLSMSDLFDDPKMRAAYNGHATYTYPGGRKVHRKPDKTFPQSGNKKDRSLFGSEAITDEANPVYVPEGEKDVLAAQSVGAVAVCSAMGAGKAHLADWSELAGHHAIIVADKDEAGRNHGGAQAKLLDGIAASVYIVEAAAGKDLADHIAAGKTLDELVPVDWWPPKQAPDDNGDAGAAGWLSDANVSELLVNRVLRGKYCWAKGLGWMTFDAKKWVATTNEAVIEQSRRFANSLVAEVVAGGAADLDKIRAYTRRLSAGAVRAAADLAKGQLLIDAELFDRHPDLLNVANGVIDLRTGELGPHDPKLLLTKCAPTNYRPDATHRDWDKSLAALPDDAADWTQLRLGQAITGHPAPDDILSVFHGAGSNGKTTITTGINRTLGEGEHAVTVPDRVLLANPGDHPTELMTLRGARLALLEETPEARHLNVKRLKDVLGTTTMTARLIRHDSVTWSPTHTLFVSTNYRPRIDETDHGTWRRLALITFPYTYRRAEETLRGERDRRGDPTLRQRIDAGRDCQHEAILKWLVDGARRWYAAGQVMVPPPETVAADTRDWRHETDLILRFFDDNLIADCRYYIPGKDLYEVFIEWLTVNGRQKWTAQTFADRFGQHDEVAGVEINHGRVRLSTTELFSSRPVVRFGTPSGLPERFRAWIGVRLRAADDDR
jgi:putative DNA primase/helicase